MKWEPNYPDIINDRARKLSLLLDDLKLQIGAKEYYKTRPVEFINDWAITYDPRKSNTEGQSAWMPFILFERQEQFVDFLYSCWKEKQSGLVEKSRDMGATWLSCAFSVWMWLFIPGTAIGWGSRKEQLVDKIGDPDSIFQKIRLIIEYIPKVFLPKGFTNQFHSSYMKLINPENGNTITGEAGDNIGRGGRKSIYFKDESAHYERPESIEAALGDNTDVQIDISSVHGNANVFARRRRAGIEWEPDKEIPIGKTRVFVMDWKHHPLKDQTWYETRRQKYEEEGLLHIFAQEVDRDYATAVEGLLIPSVWVKSSIDAHIKLGLEKVADLGGVSVALDVADEGGDTNACSVKKGIILYRVDEWRQGDTGQSAQKAIQICREEKSREMIYDCVGVGAGVKAEVNNMQRTLHNTIKIIFSPWNGGSSVIRPEERVNAGDMESPKNKDFYKNLKAQAWWNLRRRFEKTYQAIVNGKEYKTDELISISSKLPLLHKLEMELSQQTYNHQMGKIIVDKKPEGNKSPNLADSVCMLYFPTSTNRNCVWGR